MATNYSTAVWALPFFLFFFQEFVHALFFDVLQVVYHVHVVVFFVAYCKTFYVVTREFVAFVAELHLFLLELFTFFDNKGALFASWSATYTVGQFHSFAFLCRSLRQDSCYKGYSSSRRGQLVLLSSPSTCFHSLYLLFKT